LFRVNQGLGFKDKDQDQDLTVKDQNQDKDLTCKDQDKDQDFELVLKESLRTRTRTRTNISALYYIDLYFVNEDRLTTTNYTK